MFSTPSNMVFKHQHIHPQMPKNLELQDFARVFSNLVGNFLIYYMILPQVRSQTNFGIM